MDGILDDLYYESLRFLERLQDDTVHIINGMRLYSHRDPDFRWEECS